ncbi:MAG: UDP-3-O-(3-hydroxymyristoyl)glucosamine N-acyltransferase [Salibacteraceae bacterium]
MKFTASQIAQLLGGSIEGNPDVEVWGLAKIENAEPGTLTFLANPLYTTHLYKTKASIAIVSESFAAEKPLPKTLTLVRVADARLAFSRILEAYKQAARPEYGVHPTACVHPGAAVSDKAYVGPGTVVEEGASIGDYTYIYAHCFVGRHAYIGEHCEVSSGCYIGEHCIIGNHCTLQPHVVIGADGFGFAPNDDHEYSKVVHVGNVTIEDHVEIGANTTIDRATLGSTIIRRGVKLDNLIQIAHNVEIGENTVIAAQTGIAGSAVIGKNCMIGGQVGIVGHIKIADGVKIAAQSGIGSSITTQGAVVQGSPALPIRTFKKSYVHFKKLDQMAAQLKMLMAQISKPASDD